jgi:uncharacterized protein
VDGTPRPDLEGAEEPDLPVTPFCNTLPIPRTPEAPGASLPLDTAFIDDPALTVARSSQRYDRQGTGRLHYVDLGLSRGFEADLIVDGEGLVLNYEHLVERVMPALVLLPGSNRPAAACTKSGKRLEWAHSRCDGIWPLTDGSADKLI